MSIGQYLAGWDFPAVLCLILGMGLMIWEMFTPGMGLPGGLGALLLAAAIVLRADSLQTALITILLIILPLGVAAVLIFRSMSKGALSKTPIVLHESIDAGSTSLGDAAMQQLIGREGVCLTPLRPSGIALFGEEKLDVVSDGAFIDKGQPVKIIRIEGLRILVKQL